MQPCGHVECLKSVEEGTKAARTLRITSYWRWAIEREEAEGWANLLNKWVTATRPKAKADPTRHALVEGWVRQQALEANKLKLTPQAPKPKPLPAKATQPRRLTPKQRVQRLMPKPKAGKPEVRWVPNPVDCPRMRSELPQSQ